MSFGTIPLSPDDKPDGFVLLSMYEKLESENAKLRELCADLYAEMITYSKAPNYNASVWAPKLRELGVEVEG